MPRVPLQIRARPGAAIKLCEGAWEGFAERQGAEGRS